MEDAKSVTIFGLRAQLLDGHLIVLQHREMERKKESEN